ncbi:hypothetical protein BDZ91DRAFT_758728 [Kalaharituber pfeilii]|nr:hypothetical protein BDZ91DRAFT_758728 [Kalaharituber pfeilii]
MPITSLWVDIFEKVKALGFNAVGLYKRLEEELQDGCNGGLCSTNIPQSDPITDHKRRSIVLVQPENEYSYCFKIPNCQYLGHNQNIWKCYKILCVRKDWSSLPMRYNDVQYTSAPIMSQDQGSKAPSKSIPFEGYCCLTEINYIIGFICNATSIWPDGKLPTNLVHHSGGNPNSILEVGFLAVWCKPGHTADGDGSARMTATFIGPSFERVFYKNYQPKYGISTCCTVEPIGVALPSLQQLPGLFGTKQAVQAVRLIFTLSYDYGSPITKNRLLTREKYSKLKLLAHEWVSVHYEPNWLMSLENKTVFWIVRHAAYNSLENSKYKLQVPTSRGSYLIRTLQFNDGDSKEVIRNRKKFASKTILVLYGFPDEIHETAFLVPTITVAKPNVIQADALQKSSSEDGIVTINYRITSSQTVISIGSELQVVIVNRHAAFDFWVLDDAAIVKSLYLIRSAECTKSGTLALWGDLNQTQVEAELFADDDAHTLNANGQAISVRKTVYGSLRFKLRTSKLRVSLPTLAKLDWKYVDGLPEVKAGYDDSKWTKAEPCGGAFPASLYLNDQQLAYYAGSYGVGSVNLTSKLPTLKPGSMHVFTIIQDHMEVEQNHGPGGDLHKRSKFYQHQGVLGSNRQSWWGILNEGGLYAERQSFYLPGVDTASWKRGNPLDGMKGPGIHFYSTTFELNIPSGLDVPISFNFANNTVPVNFQAQLYVNGHQFGKYASNLGSQISFQVPEGILNHRGTNTRYGRMTRVSNWRVNVVKGVNGHKNDHAGNTSANPPSRSPYVNHHFDLFRAL